MCKKEDKVRFGLDAVSSERLTLLRFPLIVGIVFIHGYYVHVGFSDGYLGVGDQGWLSNFLRNLISQGFARVAVPLFFLMSGYFFFLGFPWSIDSYKRKVGSRIKTLLVPFLFWNVSVLIFLALAQSIPATQIYFSGFSAPISTFGLYDYFNALIGIDRPPIAYQFWFIRDLMVMVLLVPVLQIFLKKIPIVFLCFIFVLWFFNLWPVYIPSSTAFAFFYAGSFLGYSRYSLFKIDKYGKVIVLAYLLIVLIDTLARGFFLKVYIHKIGLLCGIAAALYTTKLVLRHAKLKAFLLWGARCSFFVFAIHELLLMVSRKIIYKLLLPDTEIMLLGLYFAIPVFVVSISIAIYVLLQSVTPKFLSIVSGEAK